MGEILLTNTQTILDLQYIYQNAKTLHALLFL